MLTPATPSRLRPTLFHLTASANLPLIQRMRRLRPAFDIYLPVGRPR